MTHVFADEYKFEKKWMIPEYLDYKITYPHIIGIDSLDNIYIKDNTGTIYVYDGDGNLKSTIFSENPLFESKLEIRSGAINNNSNSIYLLTYQRVLDDYYYIDVSVKKHFLNKTTMTNNIFNYPTIPLMWAQQPLEIAVDSKNNTYVSGFIYPELINKFSNKGEYLANYYIRIKDIVKDVSSIHGLALDSNDTLYAAVNSNIDGVSIVKLSENHEHTEVWKNTSNYHHLMDIKIDKNDNIYFTDNYSNKVTKLDNNGSIITMFGSYCRIQDINNNNLKLGDTPFDPALLNAMPYRISDCIDPDGAGPLEKGDGQFEILHSIGVDSKGNVYATDYTQRIQKFVPTNTSSIIN